MNLQLASLFLPTSIYYNEAAIGAQEGDGAGFEGEATSPPSSLSLSPSPFLFAVPIYQSSNKLISDIDLPSLPSHYPIHSVRSAERRREGRKEGGK